MKVSAALREMRESAPAELDGRLGRLEEQLFKLRIKHATNQLENLSQIRATRREIARVMTIMAERRKGNK
ncbi:MAG: 50S ribosomal protein L29 [Myxococcales bacterium]|nr:50S ribosomal protein L29 [Myxococcales bacterium]